MPNNEVWLSHLKKTYTEDPNLTLKMAMIKASQTFKKKKGEGVYQDVINVTNKIIGSKAQKLANSEFHLPDSNYTGPGTLLTKKIEQNVACLNKTDCCSKQHDIDYGVAMSQSDDKERARMIRAADNEVKDCYKKAMKDDPVLSRLAYSGIIMKNSFEDIVPVIAKKYEKEYYGSTTGGNLMTGNAKVAIYKSLYK